MPTARRPHDVGGAMEMAYNDEVKLPAGRTTAKLSATGKAARHTCARTGRSLPHTR